MELFVQDLKHAFRMFRQNRVFTVAAVAALALGIGANTAIFSVVSAVLLKPLPFPDPDNVVFFTHINRQGQGGPASSPAKFAHWRQQTTVIQDATAFRTNVVNYTGGATPEQLRAGQVSADYFKLFGARVFRGRTFAPEETCRMDRRSRCSAMDCGAALRRRSTSSARPFSSAATRTK